MASPTSVDFFHLDALSSAVALNVDFDVLLTIIGSGIYRLFAKSLRGYERVRARQLFRRFLDTTARVTISGPRDSSPWPVLPCVKAADDQRAGWCDGR
jgi:hypothetical protein